MLFHVCNACTCITLFHFCKVCIQVITAHLWIHCSHREHSITPSEPHSLPQVPQGNSILICCRVRRWWVVMKKSQEYWYTISKSRCTQRNASKEVRTIPCPRSAFIRFGCFPVFNTSNFKDRGVWHRRRDYPRNSTYFGLSFIVFMYQGLCSAPTVGILCLCIHSTRKHQRIPVRK